MLILQVLKLDKFAMPIFFGNNNDTPFDRYKRLLGFLFEVWKKTYTGIWSAPM